MNLNANQKKLLGHLDIEFSDKVRIDEDSVKIFAKMFQRISQCSDEEIEEVILSFFSKHYVNRDVGIGLVDKEQKPWYLNSKKNTDSIGWDRYRDFLVQECNFSFPVVNSLESDLDQIMDYLGNPSSSYSEFLRKGLIIGDVQSGKTSTYIGLMNKAVDAGYKVIILLTGTIEKLRNQTQERIDLGFLGQDSDIFGDNKKKKKREVHIPGLIGVGKFDKRNLGWCFTSRSGDFTTKHANSIGKLDTITSSVVFVIKKNSKVMSLLEGWLEKQNADSNGGIPLPMLLIDDEADNASINTKKNLNETTAINGCIRNLLNLFYKRNYVGFTATPYANIFIDPDNNSDLFPENFIYVLKTPSNYISPLEIFAGIENDFALDEDEKVRLGKYYFMLDIIDDFEQYLPINHKINYECQAVLPLSLQEAIVSFFIANAIRDIRGDETAHRTMLVNVSRFISVQDNLKEVIDNFIKHYSRVIKHYALLPENDALEHKEIAFIKDIFIKRYQNLPDDGYKERKHYTWDEIIHALPAAIAPITTKSINGGNASKNLDYKAYKDTGLRLVAVGGLSLSRGLTLEGLIISYYHRNTKMYDTLMQMGRWFGYRKDYADLCRIWMNLEAQSWYNYVANATEELKKSVIIMQNEGKTPRDFGLKVRSDKLALVVTAKNKMYTASDQDVLISLSQAVEETKYLSSSESTNDKNFNMVNSWVTDILKNHTFWNDSGRKYTSLYQIKDVPVDKIINMLSQYISSTRNQTFNIDVLCKLINESKTIKPFWDIVIASGIGDEMPSFGGVIGIHKVSRSFVLTKSEKDIQIAGASAHMGSRTIYRSGLTDKDYKRIENVFLCKKDNLGKDSKSMNQEDYFFLGDRNPLLVIWPLSLDKIARNAEDMTVPDFISNYNKSGKAFIGLSFGFPKVAKEDEATVTAHYKINKIESMQLLDISEDDDFEEETGITEETV